jgi:hypothetical protein
MKWSVHAMTAIAVAIILGGCETFSEFVQKVSVDPAVQEQRDQENRVTPIDLDKFPAGRKVSFYNEPTPTKEMRNSLQEAIIGRSAVTCSDFRKRLYVVHAARKIAFQSSALILSTAAAVVGGTAARALSGTSTGLLGVDETVDANALQNSAITAILNTIATARTEFLREMRTKQTRDITTYGMEAAVADAIHYNKLCSLTEAISTLNNAAEQKAANAETIKRIRITNAETLLKQAEDDLARSHVTKATTDVIKIHQDRLDRAKLALDKLRNATTSEVVAGATADN